MSKDSPYETMTIKLDMSSSHTLFGKSVGAKKLEKLIADGWEVVSENKKSALQWGYKTEFILRRPRN